MIRIVLLLIGYGFGLIQSGYFIGRLYGIDIHSKGSGNVGATNVQRVLGTKTGLIVLACDFLKAFVPCMIVKSIFRENPDTALLYCMYCGFGVVLGHNFPFYTGFRGGKGVAASAGLLFALNPLLGAVIVALFLCVVTITKFVSLGSIAAFVFYLPAACILYGNHTEFIILSFIVSLLGVIRHLPNIRRLIAGKENKFSFKRKKDE